jgi:hypothetical protein
MSDVYRYYDAIIIIGLDGMHGVGMDGWPMATLLFPPKVYFPPFSPLSILRTSRE